MKSVISTALLSIGLFSCTSNEKQSPKAEGDTVTKTTLIASDTMQKSVAPAMNGDMLLKEEALGPLSLGADMFYTNKVLGTWDSETDAEIWGADGAEHKTFTYEKGVVLDMIVKDSLNNDYAINSIKIISPSDFATQRGVKIGSSLNQVIAAYDKEIERPISDSSTITAGSVYGGLVFTIEKGKVTSIFLGASAE